MTNPNETVRTVEKRERLAKEADERRTPAAIGAAVRLLMEQLGSAEDIVTVLRSLPWCEACGWNTEKYGACYCRNDE